MSAKKDMFRSAPVLQVKDVVASGKFYTETLGFDSANTWGDPPCFCIVGRGSVTIFLDQTREEGAPTPVNQYWAAYIYIEDVEAYCAELKAKGVEIIRGPETADYGCRDFDIKDPDGHILCFGQDMQPGPDGPGL